MIGTGSAALATAVPYPGEATQIFRKGRRSTRKKFKTIRQMVFVFCFQFLDYSAMFFSQCTLLCSVSFRCCTRLNVICCFLFVHANCNKNLRLDQGKSQTSAK